MSGRGEEGGSVRGPICLFGCLLREPWGHFHVFEIVNDVGLWSWTSLRIPRRTGATTGTGRVLPGQRDVSQSTAFRSFCAASGTRAAARTHSHSSHSRRCPWLRSPNARLPFPMARTSWRHQDLAVTQATTVEGAPPRPKPLMTGADCLRRASKTSPRLAGAATLSPTAWLRTVCGMATGCIRGALWQYPRYFVAVPRG